MSLEDKLYQYYKHNADVGDMGGYGLSGGMKKPFMIGHSLSGGTSDMDAQNSLQDLNPKEQVKYESEVAHAVKMNGMGITNGAKRKYRRKPKPNMFNLGNNYGLSKSTNWNQYRDMTEDALWPAERHLLPAEKTQKKSREAASMGDKHLPLGNGGTPSGGNMHDHYEGGFFPGAAFIIPAVAHLVGKLVKGEGLSGGRFYNQDFSTPPFYDDGKDHKLNYGFIDNMNNDKHIKHIYELGSGLSGGMVRKKRIQTGPSSWQIKLAEYRKEHPGTSYKDAMIACKGSK